MYVNPFSHAMIFYYTTKFALYMVYQEIYVLMYPIKYCVQMTIRRDDVAV